MIVDDVVDDDDAKLMNDSEWRVLLFINLLRASCWLRAVMNLDPMGDDEMTSSPASWQVLAEHSINVLECIKHGFKSIS